MELSPTRYAEFHGTEVTARVDSAEEARLAVKELKHAKRELAHIRRGLTRDLKSAKAREAKTAKRSGGKRSGAPVFAHFLDFVHRSLASLPRMFGSAARHRARRKMRAQHPSAAAIEREIAAAGTLAHNIDACLLQIEAKLIKG